MSASGTLAGSTPAHRPNAPRERVRRPAKATHVTKQRTPRRRVKAPTVPVTASVAPAPVQHVASPARPRVAIARGDLFYPGSGAFAYALGERMDARDLGLFQHGADYVYTDGVK